MSIEKEVDKVFLRNQNTKSKIIHIVNTQIIANNTLGKNHDISSKEMMGKGRILSAIAYCDLVIVFEFIKCLCLWIIKSIANKMQPSFSQPIKTCTVYICILDICILDMCTHIIK